MLNPYVKAKNWQIVILNRAFGEAKNLIPTYYQDKTSFDPSVTSLPQDDKSVLNYGFEF